MYRVDGPLVERVQRRQLPDHGIVEEDASVNIACDVSGEYPPLDVHTLVLHLRDEALARALDLVGHVGWARQKADFAYLFRIDLLDQRLKVLPAHVLLVPEDLAAEAADHFAQS